MIHAKIKDVDLKFETESSLFSPNSIDNGTLAMLSVIDFLPDDCTYRFKLFNKISFLYASATEDKDLKLTAFLQVLLSRHGLSKKTVAAMAGVETKDIERLLSNPPKKVSEEIKFKIAVTVMSLRFFLKDCEPQL